MGYIISFIAMIAVISAFLTYHLLKATQENDVQKLILLKEEIEHEKEQRKFYTKEQNRFEQHREGIDQQLLQIKLEVINTEDDLKDLIPNLLH